MSIEPREHDGRNWWDRPFSIFQTNLQEIDATLDVQETLDFIQDYGSDTWLINTGGIVSFYPSDLDFQTRNPFLDQRESGDLVGDAVAAAHDRGVRVLARVDFSKVSSRIAEEHPDWLFVSAAGEPQVYNSLYSVCPSREYYQRRSFEIMDEIMDRYPVDGFFINWFGFSEVDYSRVRHGVCHCPDCRTSFAEFSGGAVMPVTPDDENYDVWTRWAIRGLIALTRRLASHISARRPDAALVLGPEAHLSYYEASNAFGREYWPYRPAEDASRHRVSKPDMPIVMNCVSFVDMPYRIAGEQPESFGQYLIQAISRGAHPSTYIMGAPERVPYAHLRSSAVINRFYRDHHDLYGDLRPASRIGVVHSAAANTEEFRGVYAALTETHRTFEGIAVEALPELAAASGLDAFDLLILPDLGAVSPAVADALDAFAEAGGAVLLTGGSAIAADGAVQLRNAPATISAKPLEGAQLWSSYASIATQPDLDRYRLAAAVIPVWGHSRALVWRPEAERIGVILTQAPFGPPEKSWGHRPGGDPAYGRRRVGAGSVTIIPWTIGVTYREFATTEVRDLLIAVVDELQKPAWTFDLPEQVDVNVGRSGESLVVHVNNQSGMRRRSFRPHLPIQGGRIHLAGRERAATVEFLVDGSRTTIEPRDASLSIDLPVIGQFEVVVVSA